MATARIFLEAHKREVCRVDTPPVAAFMVNGLGCWNIAVGMTEHYPVNGDGFAVQGHSRIGMAPAVVRSIIIARCRACPQPARVAMQYIRTDDNPVHDALKYMFTTVFHDYSQVVSSVTSMGCSLRHSQAAHMELKWSGLRRPLR